MASFFFDNDADMRIGRDLKRRGHMVTSAAQQHLERVSDSELLLFAGPAGLVVVTHNERDFVALHDPGFIPHAGILSVPQVPSSAVS